MVIMIDVIGEAGPSSYASGLGHISRQILVAARNCRLSFGPGKG